MKNGRMQAKDIDDRAILGIIKRTEDEQGRWTFYWDVAEELKVPRPLVLAKAGTLIKRGLMSGCVCGCRGDFELTKAGEDFLKAGST